MGHTISITCGRIFSWMSVIAVLVLSPPVLAQNTGATGKGALDDSCLGCHSVSGKVVDTLAKLWSRKGPDLSSAGIKYKKEWLINWLQNPVRIRPAGMFYGNHIKPGPKNDVIDESSLIKHPQLSKEEAVRAVDVLMGLKAHQERIKQGDYKPGTIPLRIGELVFDKFKGCMTCHQIEPGFGGASGPEMYTAGKRLQEDYMISFMRDPQKWEPKTFMPNKHLDEGTLQKIIHYLRVLSMEDFK